MIRARDITDAEAADKAKSRGIMDLAPRQGNLYAFDPRQLHVEPSWNSRTTDFDAADEDDLALARSIAEVGVKQPLTVYMRDGVPTVTDGHRRLAATLYAIDSLGAEIKSIPVQTESKYASEADRVLSQLVRNQGKPLAPIEKANVYAKLIGFGWAEGEIAKKVGASRQHVVDLLALRASTKDIVDMVTAGEVSATLATQTIKAAKGDEAAATETLSAAVSKAKEGGKSRATARYLKPKAAPGVEVLSVPKNHPTYKAGWDEGKAEGRTEGEAKGRAAGLRRAAEIAREGGHDDAAALIELEFVNG